MDKQISLNILAEEAAKCTACVLHESRNKSVFGSGNINAKILFLGESPGLTESETGFPFVGRSGKLLTNMIKSMGLSREDDVYIMNCVKCRPPNNRKPTFTELQKCSGFFEKQIKLIDPKLIIALGSTAAENLVGYKVGILKEHGNFFKYPLCPKNYDVLITFHPSALLRNQSWKALAAEDLKKALVFLKDKII